MNNIKEEKDKRNNNINNDNSKIDERQSCVISRVFKDRYLLYSIVQRIRRECLVLGAMMPEKIPSPIRYHWVPIDPLLVIINRQYNLLIDYINDIKPSKKKQKTTKKSITTPTTTTTTTTTTILKIFLKTNQSPKLPWIWELIRSYFTNVNVQILDDIIQEIGVKALLETKDDGKRLIPPTTQYLVSYVVKTLDLEMIKRIYKNPLEGALKSHNKEFVSKTIKSVDMKGGIQASHNYIFPFLSRQNINLDDENLLENLKSLVECIHMVHPDMGNLNETIHDAIGYPISSPPSIPYFILWLFQYLISTSLTFTHEDKMVRLVISLFPKTDDNNKKMNMVNYCVSTFAFSTICSYGSLEFVQQSYHYILENKQVAKGLDSTDTKVLDFLIGILKKQESDMDDHGHLKYFSIDLHPDVISSLSTALSPSHNGPLFEYFVNHVTEILDIYSYEWDLDKRDMKVVLWHGHFKEADILLKREVLYRIDTKLTKVNSLTMASYYKNRETVEPCFGSKSDCDANIAFANEEILSKVFKDRYLLKLILSTIRRECLVFDARMPIVQLDDEQGEDENTPLGIMDLYTKCERYVIPIRYQWLKVDPSMAVHNNNHALFLDYIGATPKEQYNGIFKETIKALPKIVSPLYTARLFQLFSQQFKQHFQINRSNPTKESITAINNYLTSTLSPSQDLCLETWKIINNFINSNCLILNDRDDGDNQQQQQPVQQQPLTMVQRLTMMMNKNKEKQQQPLLATTILQVLIPHREGVLDAYSYVLELIRVCIRSNQLEILEYIIQDIGMDGFKRIPVDQFNVQLTDPTQVDIVSFIFKQYGLAFVNRIFSDPFYEALSTHNKEYVSLVIASNHTKDHTNLLVSIQTYLNNFLYIKLSPASCKGNILEGLGTLVECLELIKISGLSSKNIHNTIGYQLVSPPSQRSISYYLLWLLEYNIQVHKIAQVKQNPYQGGISSLVITHFQKNSNNNNNNNHNSLIYLLKTCGFSSICTHGSLELVQDCYQYLVSPNRDREIDLLDTKHHGITLQSTNIQVLQFLVGILKQQQQKKQNEPTIGINVVETCFVILNLLKPTKNIKWELVEYLIMEVTDLFGPDQFWTLSFQTLQYILLNGRFDLMDKLLRVRPSLREELFTRNIEVNSLEMAQYVREDCIVPIFSKNHHRNVLLVNDLYKLSSALNKEKFLSMAITSLQAPIIKYMYQYQGITNPPKCNIDQLMRAKQFQVVESLVDCNIPLEIISIDTWKIVGTYGSPKWIDLLMTYTKNIMQSPSDLQNYVDSLVNGLRWNIDQSNILDYLSNHTILKSKINLEILSSKQPQQTRFRVVHTMF
ncbi:hypothetical protein DFA_10645 [Cavenderia fasciculata]|uniref:Uncharacterized protein n=1 Tax=Cavenderia fasciculata TaxID=261658 RepID=F4QB00_CACFS|nr:uncharacterized protein DFA_10645 [Cavenderia fasciculata]EGG14772.1 hypothetical protein DFA_10645 [Cavenderia fasciculata]|eukprot:XP_004351288.1 hypothetical protein DFA_10645 [Cavenderia fasciculata]